MLVIGGGKGGGGSSPPSERYHAEIILGAENRDKDQDTLIEQSQ